MITKRPLLPLVGAITLLATLAGNPRQAMAQEPVHWDMVSRIRAEGFENSQVAEFTAYLSDVIGPRITASPAMRQAQAWLMGQMEEIGLSRIHTEPWGEHTVGWDMERVSVHMLEPDYQMVIGYPFAFTPGTGGPVIERAVAAVIETPADMDRFRGQLRGAIVLATPPMSMTPRFAQDAFRHTEESLRVFETEGVDLLSARHARGQLSQASFRSEVPEDELERFYKEEGVAAVLKASIGADGTVAVTGRPSSRSDRSRAGIENSIPTLSVATEHYNRIYRILDRDIPVSMEVDVRVIIDDSDPMGYNVIAEIPGTDLAHEVVGIGGHLDSWHTGTGATDNAGGVAVALEAMRILKALDVKPRRTIRIFLWSHEEGGLRGSRGYVRNHFGSPEEGTKPDYDNFSVYFNMDNGTGQFRGVHLQGNTLVTPIFEAWMKPFHDLEVRTLSQFSNRGTDHLAFDQAGLPGFQFVQDRIDYRARTHHFNMDTFDKVLPEDLMINAAVMASFAYHAAMRDELIPRKE
jgi:carboxypeptidase Q